MFSGPNLARGVALVLLLPTAGCYLSHEREADAAPPSIDAARPADDTHDAGVRLCGCPGDPRAHVCVLPLMCCPATETCEDPAHFSCTGSNPCR